MKRILLEGEILEEVESVLVHIDHFENLCKESAHVLDGGPDSLKNHSLYSVLHATHVRDVLSAYHTILHNVIARYYPWTIEKPFRLMVNKRHRLILVEVEPSIEERTMINELFPDQDRNDTI